MNVLMVGDIVGKLGRRTAAALLPEIRRSSRIDLVIANGENAAGGRGLPPAVAEELYQAGIDVITSGNHIWAYQEIYPILDSGGPVLRPANYPSDVPGRGIYTHNGIAVINLMGRTFMPGHLDCPFRAADEALAGLRDYRCVIVDIHAEATSEKIGIAYYLDGRVSAVLGTHTHIPTSDCRVLPKGTAYVTDVGMVGALHSILGMEIKPVIQRFLTQLPTRFAPVERGPAVFNSVLVQIDPESGRALAIQRLDREVA
ncbi:MAG: metallophosphoesterase [Acidobacteria bacterium RBG_16_64_8]|nr:MAG: metallophosphoesterase [Acidobacteria bacterium RBG_16_64_8]